MPLPTFSCGPILYPTMCLLRRPLPCWTRWVEGLGSLLTPLLFPLHPKLTARTNLEVVPQVHQLLHNGIWTKKTRVPRPGICQRNSLLFVASKSPVLFMALQFLFFSNFMFTEKQLSNFVMPHRRSTDGMDLSAAPACEKQKKIILPPSLLSGDYSSPFPNPDLLPTKELFQAPPLQVDKCLTSGKALPRGQWLRWKGKHRAGLKECPFTFPGSERAEKPHWQPGSRISQDKTGRAVALLGCSSSPQLLLPILLAILVLLCTENLIMAVWCMGLYDTISETISPCIHNGIIQKRKMACLCPFVLDKIIAKQRCVLPLFAEFTWGLVRDDSAAPDLLGTL